MANVLFSIVIVCLNAGEKLQKTFASVKLQSFRNFEVLIKDGLSVDNSVEKLLREERELAQSPEAPYLKVVEKKDTGIYDAMNQAICKTQGEYLLFLNCGDCFYDKDVLKKIAEAIAADREQGEEKGIYYGDTFCEKTKAVVASPRKITGFTCFRNIPCHQSCFYHRSLFVRKKYEPEYRIRADYDHFLWCFYRGGARPQYIGLIVAAYEGGGYSESKENQKRDRQEHRLITEEYMSAAKLFSYRAAMVLTLAPLRTRMAENKVFSGLYQTIKRLLYGRR